METVTVKETLDDGDVYRFKCPPGCLAEAQAAAPATPVVGAGVYAEFSAICMAAIHAGLLTDAGVRT